MEGITPEHRIAQEEVFGPVLAVMKVRDFDQALEWANSTAYALTGAVFSRSPRHLEKASARFNVGNLYLNRGSTGALVERHPFGGFHMSGIGSKAGGALGGSVAEYGRKDGPSAPRRGAPRKGAS